MKIPEMMIHYNQCPSYLTHRPANLLEIDEKRVTNYIVCFSFLIFFAIHAHYIRFFSYLCPDLRIFLFRPISLWDGA